MKYSSSFSGFTLIEVLLVIILLAFLSMATFTSIQATLDAKEKVDKKTEVLQASRAALSIMERDIRLTFYNFPEDLGWQPVPRTDENQSEFVPPVLPNSVSYFKGSNQNLLFSSRSHLRLAANSPESNEHFVSYELKNEELIRGETLRALTVDDRKDTTQYRTFKVLEHVKKINFRFWDINKNDWSTDWDTENSLYNKRIPGAVEVTLEYMPASGPNEIPDDKQKPIKLFTIISLVQSTLKLSVLQAQSITPSPSGLPPGMVPGGPPQ